MPVSAVRKSCAMASSITDLHCSLCRAASIFAAIDCAGAFDRGGHQTSQGAHRSLGNGRAGYAHASDHVRTHSQRRQPSITLCVARQSLPLAATFKRPSSICATPVPARRISCLPARRLPRSQHQTIPTMCRGMAADSASRFPSPNRDGLSARVCARRQTAVQNRRNHKGKKRHALLRVSDVQ